MELEAEAKKLVDYLESLGDFEIATAQRPCEHIGAIIVDAVLQVGHNFETQVRKRVERIRDNYPEAVTISGFLHLLEEKGAAILIEWIGKDVEIRLHDHAKFFTEKGIDTFAQLYEWLKPESNRDSLLTKNGGPPRIADKTADYYRVLVGIPDAVAVDRNIKDLFTKAGIDNRKYQYKEQRTIVQLAALHLDCRPIDLDSSIYDYSVANSWRYESKSKRISRPLGGMYGRGKNMTGEEEKMDKDTTLKETYVTAKITSQGKADKYKYRTGPAAGFERAEIRVPKAQTKILPYSRHQYPVAITLVIGQGEYAAKLRFAKSQEAAWISSVLKDGNFELVRALKLVGLEICQPVRLKVMENKIWVLKA